MTTNQYDALIALGYSPEHAQYAVDTDRLATKLRKNNPTLAPNAAFVMAQDTISAQHWAERVRNHTISLEDALTLAGSPSELRAALGAWRQNE